MITPDFDGAWQWIVEEEGVTVSDDPRDPGGLTKFGISKRSHPDIDIRSLTRDQARDIYLNEYWLRAGCEQLPPGWGLAVFDAAVLEYGPRGAVRTMQAALHVHMDGVTGPATVAAARASDDIHFAAFIGSRIRSVMGAPGHDVYLGGWVHRIVRLSLICARFGVST